MFTILDNLDHASSVKAVAKTSCALADLKRDYQSLW